MDLGLDLIKCHLISIGIATGNKTIWPLHKYHCSGFIFIAVKLRSSVFCRHHDMEYNLLNILVILMRDVQSNVAI